MKRHILVLTLCLGLAACGQSEEEKAAEEMRQAAEEMKKAADELRDVPESLEDAMGQVAEAFGGEAKEAVSAKSLKEMLPQEWPDMKRVRASANRNGAMGFTVSVAEAEFESEDARDNQRLTFKISDIGAMQSMARLGMGWLNAEIDEETEDGFKRTTRYKGHPAMEKFETRGSTTKASKLVFVDSRFLVELTGENISFDTIDEALDKLPIKELSEIATVPAD